MEHIRNIFDRGLAPRDPAFRAAEELDVINRILREALRTEPQDARATSIRSGQVVIRVSHAALIGKITQQHHVLLDEINRQLEQRNQHRKSRVNKLLPRVTS
ncbi:MAG: hypothetical protein HY092_00605 [Candidatus Kerfeldbacteria bacterium]|nr:hypothetical protein [Candidatus Kerfeldbacteria bacterium]